MEPFLIPYKTQPVPDARRVLVLAPHPDDEVFGCGGAVALHVAQGAHVQPLVLTSGEGGGDALARERESENAARILGTTMPTFWRLTDRQVRADQALVTRLSQLIVEGNFDLVYAPSPWEIHPDHRQAAILARLAVLQSRCSVWLAFYEIGNTLRPNVLVDITTTAATKLRAMMSFHSQLERQNYARHIGALNRYRTYTLPSSVTAAEAFYVIDPTDLAADPDLTHLPCVAAGEQQPVQHANGPLVSVMVRSTDRVELAQALDSVALQTYPNIEVLVQAVRPGHQPLPDHCGPYPLRWFSTESNLPRSEAANQLLDAAQGEWLLFLDDDDWLMPSHIARLVDTLSRQSFALAAYSGVLLVDANNQPMGQAFDLPFDAVRQQSGNLTPIHAVLFSKTLVQRGCRFDTQLARYEDWDFWLKVAGLTPLLHLPGLTAAYRVHDSSGVHRVSDQTSDWQHAIHEKWAELWTAGDKQAVMNKVWEFSNLEQRLLDANEQLEVMRQQVDRLQQSANEGAASQDSAALVQQRLQLQLQEAELDAARQSLSQLHQSASWRVTKPLRWVSAKMRAGWFLRQALKLVRVWRREGFRGLRYRLEQRAAVRDQLHETLGYTDWALQFDPPAWVPPQNIPTLALGGGNSSGTSVSRSDTGPFNPLISVVMPVYNPPLSLLIEAIDSIRRQHHSNWELCIADDASTDPNVWPTLADLMANEPRIKAIRRQDNGHISAASNSALALASGDFIALMDNDDLLPPDALACVADAIRAHPDVNIIYSDEDKLSPEGIRFGGYLKPAWNHTLFLGHNLISHLGVYRRALVEQLGGFRVGYEGSQDYDLALRCVAHSQPDQIVHIPKVLYHWRVLPGSTALGATEKPYALTSASKALNEHLALAWPGARAEITEAWNYRLVPPRVDLATRATLLLVRQASGTTSKAGVEPTDPLRTLSQDQAKLAAQCHDWVECGSDPDSFNEAIRSARTEWVVLLDERLTELDADGLKAMVAHLTRPGVAMVSGAVFDRRAHLVDGALVLSSAHGYSPLFSGLPHHHPGYMGRAQLPQEVSAAWLGCCAIRRDTFVSLGGIGALGNARGLDHWASIEWCLRAREAGHLIVWEPRSTWQYLNTAKQLRAMDTDPEELSNGPIASPVRVAAQAAIQSGHARWFDDDPAYHPVLNPAKGDFSLRPVTPPSRGRTQTSLGGLMDPAARH